MIVPRWYRFRNSVRVIVLTKENKEEVKSWITKNTPYQFNINSCRTHIHAYTYEPSHREVTIPLDSVIVIDESNEVRSYSKRTFENLFYEVGYRTVEVSTLPEED